MRPQFLVSLKDIIWVLCYEIMWDKSEILGESGLESETGKKKKKPMLIILTLLFLKGTGIYLDGKYPKFENSMKVTLVN